MPAGRAVSVPGRAFARAGRLLIGITALGSVAAAATVPANYIYVGSGDLAGDTVLLDRPDIAGAQVVYSWKELEPSFGHYDFSEIEGDLALASRRHKKLFVQVQDRFFSKAARNVPAYLLTDPRYKGGLAAQIGHPGENKPVTSGWVAMQWVPAVRQRFDALLRALAARFDGRIYGVNLPETAADLEPGQTAAGFTCDAYFQAELANMAAARAAFHRSYVVQYVNFWPCEWNDNHHYMSRLFAFAAAHRIGLGGPDVVPWRKGQMKNAYPFFHRYKGKLPLVAMAVQEPTLTYRDPATGKPFTRQAFESFAADYLGADIIFWTPQAPWLRR